MVVADGPFLIATCDALVHAGKSSHHGPVHLRGNSWRLHKWSWLETTLKCCCCTSRNALAAVAASVASTDSVGEQPPDCLLAWTSEVLHCNDTAAAAETTEEKRSILWRHPGVKHHKQWEQTLKTISSFANAFNLSFTLPCLSIFIDPSKAVIHIVKLLSKRA